jgi:hypothetical protein
MKGFWFPEFQLRPRGGNSVVFQSGRFQVSRFHTPRGETQPDAETSGEGKCIRCRGFPGLRSRRPARGYLWQPSRAVIR